MDRLTEKQLVILIAAVSVIIAGILGTLTYLDLKKIGDMEEENLANCGKIDATRGKIDQIKGLEHDVIVLRENLNEYVKILPDDQEINDFVNRISQFSQKANVEVTSLTDKRSRQSTKAKNAFEQVIYRMRLKGNLSQFMTFINLFENFHRFVRINSFTIKAGKNQEKAVSLHDLKHDVDLELETFVYNPSGSSAAKVKILDYENKKKDLLEEIIKARNSIRIQKYDYREPLERRDPFVDARISFPGGLGSKPGDILTQRDILKRGKEEFAAIQVLIEREEKEDNLVKKVELKKEIDDKMREFLSFVDNVQKGHSINFPVYKEEWNKTVVAPFQEMLKDRKLKADAERLSMDELLGIRNRMEKPLREGDPAQVVSIFQTVQMNLNPDGAPEEMKRVIIEILEMKDTAEKVIEFSKRKIYISGLIHRPESSVALINGKVVGEGDAIDSDLVLKKIFGDRVEFDFKGITVSKGFR